jgi:hypothetical protein
MSFLVGVLVGFAVGVAVAAIWLYSAMGEGA